MIPVDRLAGRTPSDDAQSIQHGTSSSGIFRLPSLSVIALTQTAAPSRRTSKKTKDIP